MLKRVTFSVGQELFRRATERARRENTTINIEFGKWLNQYALVERRQIDFVALMKSLGYANSGKSFSREERNRRE